MLLRQHRSASERTLRRRDHDARALEPGRLSRMLARARAGTLNAALIAGADPARSRQLAARARRLASPRYRRSLANVIEQLPQRAQQPAGRRRVRPSRRAVVANAAELGELAALLRADAPLYARGVAVLDELLCDGTGPLYRGDAAALALRLWDARAAIFGAL